VGRYTPSSIRESGVSNTRLVDSKYISVRDGQLADFEMNKICAGGTASFLEEQAEGWESKLSASSPTWRWRRPFL